MSFLALFKKSGGPSEFFPEVPGDHIWVECQESSVQEPLSIKRVTGEGIAASSHRTEHCA